MSDGRDSVDLADLFGLDGGRVHIGRPLGDAGQGRLYAREGHLGTAVKLFSPAFLFRSATDLRAKLTWMIEHPPADVVGRYRFAWPRELVVDRTGALAGYILAGPVDGVELRTLFVRGRQPAAAAQLPDWLVGPPGHRPHRADRPRVARDWRLLAQAAANLAAATAALHELGYVIGDFHDGLVRVSSQGVITLVDCDAVQVTVPGRPGTAGAPQESGARGDTGPLEALAAWPGPVPDETPGARDDAADRVYRAPIGRPEFTPAELLAERGRPLTPAADDYALAVHCFALLFGGHRPYTGIWRASGDEPSPLGLARLGLYALTGDGRLDPPGGMPPGEVLPAELAVLFDRAFGPGAGVSRPRPAAAAWRDMLRTTADELVTCARTQTHHYRPGLGSCPWCARDDSARGRAAPLLPAALPTVAPTGALTVVNAPPARTSGPQTRPAPHRAAGAARPPGPRHRTPARSAPRQWAGKVAATVLCLLGAVFMALTVFGAVDQPSANDQAHADTGGPTPGGVVAANAASAGPASASPASANPASGHAPGAATASPGQAPSRPLASQPAAIWPWLGRWQSIAASSLPGFALRIDDDGVTGGQEQIVATETSGPCPVRYHGTIHARLDGPISTWPLDASVRLTLDATLPAGQDPKGCTLLPDPASYQGTGGDTTAAGVIRFQVIAAIDDLAQVSVTVRPGETVNLIMQRV